MQEKIVKYLISKGHKEIKGRSSKYRTFTHYEADQYYFVGRNGALRVGKNIGDSVSISGFIKTRITK